MKEPEQSKCGYEVSKSLNLLQKLILGIRYSLVIQLKRVLLMYIWYLILTMMLDGWKLWISTIMEVNNILVLLQKINI